MVSRAHGSSMFPALLLGYVVCDILTGGTRTRQPLRDSYNFKLLATSVTEETDRQRHQYTVLGYEQYNILEFTNANLTQLETLMNAQSKETSTDPVQQEPGTRRAGYDNAPTWDGVEPSTHWRKKRREILFWAEDQDNKNKQQHHNCPRANQMPNYCAHNSGA